MDKKEFFRKELKVEKARGLQKLWYNVNEKLLMNAVDKYIETELKFLNLHSVVQHREPFVKYMVWFRKQNLGQYDHENINEQLADNYIKFLNSG